VRTTAALALSLSLLAATASAARGAPEAPTPRGVTTLYALDPLRSTLNLATGETGAVFQDHGIADRGSDLAYGLYAPDALTVGVVGRRLGTIVDLGTSADLAKRHGYAEVAGGGQGYASIHLEGRNLVITRRPGTGTFQGLRDAGALFAARGVPQASAPVLLGHVYLVRVTDETDPSFERLAKVLVVGHVPGQSVAIRWSPLR
jgi:hypothetical protein